MAPVPARGVPSVAVQSRSIRNRVCSSGCPRSGGEASSSRATAISLRGASSADSGVEASSSRAASSARSIVLGLPVISSSGVSRSEAEASSGAVAPLVEANSAGVEVEASFSSKTIHSPRYEDNSDEYGAPSSEGSRTVSGGCQRASPALLLIAGLTGVAAVEEGPKEEFVYSKACGARDCELGKLHDSIFPYFSGGDTDLCFTGNRARAMVVCFSFTRHGKAS